MDIQKRFIINDIIEEKREGLSWDEAYKKVKGLNKDIYISENIIEKCKKEYLERIEEEQYIYSLS